MNVNVNEEIKMDSEMGDRRWKMGGLRFEVTIGRPALADSGLGAPTEQKLWILKGQSAEQDAQPYRGAEVDAEPASLQSEK